MNTRIKNSSIGRVTDLTYYDVTNYYFETMYGDDDVYELDENNEIVKDEKGQPVIVQKGFRKKGVSKEGKKEPIVQMDYLLITMVFQYLTSYFQVILKIKPHLKMFLKMM